MKEEDKQKPTSNGQVLYAMKVKAGLMFESEKPETYKEKEHRLRKVRERVLGPSDTADQNMTR